jgi:hypothetical protein
LILASRRPETLITNLPFREQCWHLPASTTF